jgi:Zn-dependent peptidase ImmA (M78 family)/transcriptional regulator with XRE-family HTH domain
MPKINARIMTWARESAGLSLAEAARAIGLSGANAVTRLEEMEAGRRDPSRRQLTEMAKKYRRPLLTFYLPEPPRPGRRTHDFRTLPHREAGSEAILDALVRDVKARQALVRSALEDAEEDEPLPFVGSVQPGQGGEVLADAMHHTLGLDLAEYRAAGTIDEAFRILRDAVEQAGVLVILKGNLGHHTSNLSPSVFRGFAIADPVAPFIVINETDSRSAWSFTLLHELAHVFLGESGISGYESEQGVERLCNDAAARFLLQHGELQEIRVGGAHTDDLAGEIGAFADARKVSRKMVAYNMARTGIISGAMYRRLAERFDADRLEHARQPVGGAADYYVVRRHRVGRGLIRLVDRLVAGGALTATKAGKVLGVRPTAVGRMTESVRAA